MPRRNINYKNECNILIGILLGVSRVTVDLPPGYHGLDYVKDYVLMEEALRKIHSILYDKFEKKNKKLDDIQNYVEDRLQVLDPREQGEVRKVLVGVYDLLKGE